MSTNPEPGSSLPTRSVFVAAIALSIAFIVASITGIPQLWGINLLKFRSIAPLVAAIVFLAAAFTPRISHRLTCAFETASVRLSRIRSSRIRFGIIGTVVFLILASITYQSIPLLGDGSLRAGEVLDKMWWQPTEFLDQLIHVAAFQYIFEPLSLKPTICYRVISIICGVVFLWGVLRLSIYLMPERNLFAFFAMVTSGMAVLFFGYVESYSILAALLPWVILVAVRTVDGRTSILNLLLWILIAILVHSVALFIFGLPLIAALVLSKEPDPKLRKKFFVIGLVLIAVGTLAWYELAYLGVGSAARYLLPIFRKGGPGQGLLTIDHALNLVNWLFLSALPYLLFLPMFFGSFGRENFWASNRRLLSATMVLSSLWFIVFFNPQLGGPRDWDLFSLPTFVLIPATMIYLSTLPLTQKLMRALVPVLVMSLVLMWSFATVNASVTKSVDRYVELLQVSRFKNQWVEYSELYQFATQRPELAEDRLEFILAAWEQGPRTEAESLLTITKIAQTYLDIDRPDSAESYIDQALAIDSLYLDGYILRLHAFTAPSDRIRAVKTAERLISIFPDSSRAVREAGVIFLRFGEQDRGRDALEEALRRSPNDYLTLLNLGSYYLSVSSEPQKSIDLLSRAALRRPEAFQANYYLALAFEVAQRPAKAREYLKIAAGLASTREQREAVEQATSRLNAN